MIGTSRGFAGRLLCVASIVAYGCAATPAPNTQLAVPVNETRTQVVLHGKTLDLHLARPAALPPGAPLVLYASGDGGWFGAAVDMWRQMGKAGYATAGFSARAFLKIERPRGSVMNPAQIALEDPDDRQRRAPGAGTQRRRARHPDRLVARCRILGVDWN